jgi:hypothetical protein
MPDKRKYKFKIRKFLNRDLEMPAYIVASVPEFEKFNDGTVRTSLYPTLTISDCSRQINLDFGFSGSEERKEVKNKINIIRDTINKFAEALEKALDEADKNDRSTKTKHID